MQAENSRKRIRSVLVPLALLILLIGGLFRYCNPGPTEEEIKSLISKNLPVGSNVQQVRTFLESRQISCNYYPNQPHGSLFDEVEPSKQRVVQGYLTAGIPEVEQGFLTKSGIYMQFYFDKNKRLVDYTVKKWVMAP